MEKWILFQFNRHTLSNESGYNLQCGFAESNCASGLSWSYSHSSPELNFTLLFTLYVFPGMFPAKMTCCVVGLSSSDWPSQTLCFLKLAALSLPTGVRQISILCKWMLLAWNWSLFWITGGSDTLTTTELRFGWQHSMIGFTAVKLNM